ncbi:MAG: SpvB/TcaC N-terminal domain-containing protein [Nannocystales bacterium]
MSFNPATGSASVSVPIATTPGRSGFELGLSLSYDTGNGNGPFGMGWSLSTPSITRKTQKGLPRYFDDEHSDVFVLSGAEDLVPVATPSQPADGMHEVQRYRPRVEGLFARIERWMATDGTSHWQVTTRDNALNVYGRTGQARIADPDNPTRIYAWMLEETRDDRGNVARYVYRGEDGLGVVPTVEETSRFRGSGGTFSATAQRYLHRVQYGNAKPVAPDDETPVDPSAYRFELVLDYGDFALEDESVYAETAAIPEDETARPAVLGAGAWTRRADPYSTYRPGFEVRTYRRCRRALMFHRFPAGTRGLPVSPCLVRSTDFFYDESASVSYLTDAVQCGYAFDLAAGRYRREVLPALSFGYTRVPDQLHRVPHSVGSDAFPALPGGIDGQTHRFVDLNGEGLPGVLTQQASSWWYRSNRGDGRLDPPRPLRTLPVESDLNGGVQLIDINRDGRLDPVTFQGPFPGYYTRSRHAIASPLGLEGWEGKRHFEQLPNLDWSDPNMRTIDLDGDGQPDLLITEQHAFVWYRSKGTRGFESGGRWRKPLSEDDGPAIVFSDGTETIALADMSGDGLTDIVRVRNRSICYWPNLGFGRFGAKVEMAMRSAGPAAIRPHFDATDQFSPRRVRFADIDGSGTTDILYLHADGVDVYANASGNGLLPRQRLGVFAALGPADRLDVVDLFGRGTSVLVRSKGLNATRPIEWLDPLAAMPEGGHKPHLLRSVRNNLGAETHIAYSTSVVDYRRDLESDSPWLTRLPFPVQVVRSVLRIDHINRTRLVSEYAYHHGYYDPQEHEFRGFASVEQRDTESVEAAQGAGLFGALPYDLDPDAEGLSLPPVRTRTWFHTGAWLEREPLELALTREYYEGDARAPTLPDTLLPPDLSTRHSIEAARALRGKTLRQEVYADDGPPSQEHPYSVTEANYQIRLLDTANAGPEDRQHGVFFATAHESLTLHYEREPNDPRLTQEAVLAFDDYGNTTRTVSVVYPRRGAQVTEQQARWATVTDARFGSSSAPGTYRVTSPDDPLGQPRQQDPDYAWYRIGVPIESATWELQGLPAPQDDAQPHSVETLRAWLEQAPRVAPATGSDVSSAPQTPTLRLLSAQAQTYYDHALAPLPVGQVGNRAIGYETYALAMTRAQVADSLEHAWTNKTTGETTSFSVDDALLQLGCGYTPGAAIDRTGDSASLVPPALWDGTWWAPSGHVEFASVSSATAGFFLPRSAIDPLGSRSTVTYDDDSLSITEAEDAVENLTLAYTDYRVLQPWRVRDPNENFTELSFDALGMVRATALRGTGDEGDLLQGVPEQLTLVMQEDPFTHRAELLGQASTRLVYDLHAFRRWQDAGGDPGDGPVPPGAAVWSAALARETHVADLRPGERSKIQVAFAYSDGSGREVMTKAQAEPGMAPARQGGVLVRDADGALREEHVTTRWVGTGRTVFDNKGNPVKQYEPFFSSSWRYEDEDDLVRTGVTPVMHYDPLGRLVRTDLPDGTHTRVEFGPWSQTTWDANDSIVAVENNTVDPSDGTPWWHRWHEAPTAWAYVLAYVEAPLPGSQEPKWDSLASLATELAVPLQNPENPSTSEQKQLLDQLGARKRAARLAAEHAGTPTMAELDTLGRAFVTITRPQRGQDYVTRVVFDVGGNPLQVTDPRALVVQRQAYDAMGRPMRMDSPDAGTRRTLMDVRGNPVMVWDARGVVTQIEYDAAARPSARWATRPQEPRKLMSRTIFGEALGPGAAANLRGLPYRVYDPAGEVTTLSADFKANVVRSQRRLFDAQAPASEAMSDKETLAPDWSAVAPPGAAAGDFVGGAQTMLEPTGLAYQTVFETRALHDALGREVLRQAPDGTVHRTTFNEANLLEKVELWPQYAGVFDQSLVRAAGGWWQSYVEGIEYDAKGQRTRIEYGNGAVTTYRYDPQTFRLLRLHTRSANRTVQSLAYTYDPSGNITQIRDWAQQDRIAAGEVVVAVGRYRYDALYQLIEATGREHPGQQGSPGDSTGTAAGDAGHGPPSQVFDAADNHQLRNYTETYRYDASGNIEALAHDVPSANRRFVRDYLYPEDADNKPLSNRLVATRSGPTGATDPEPAYTHDDNGNLTAMPHLVEMVYDVSDRMSYVDLGGGGSAHYAYDEAGERVRKVWSKGSGGHVAERIYVGGFEVYRERVSGRIELERETVHVTDDAQRVAMVERKTRDGGADVPGAVGRVRYQLSNHLGSVGLELSSGGEVLSYEEYLPFGGTAYRATRSGGAEDFVRESPRRYRYNGKERDEESGLYYHGARYYACWLGRWCAADPAGLVDGTSLFVYVQNRPVSLVDKTGLYSEGGHYYTTYLVALAVGMDRRDAQRVALFSQIPDEVDEFNAVRLLANNGALSGAAADRALTLNSDCRFICTDPGRIQKLETDFAEALSESEVGAHILDVHGSVHSLTGLDAKSEREERFRQVIASSVVPGSPTQGFAVHALADSFAHTRLDGSGALFAAGIGHGLQGHAPDHVSERPLLYIQYVKTLYRALSSAGLTPEMSENDLISAIWKIAPLSGDDADLIAGLRVIGDAVGGMSEYAPEDHPSRPLLDYLDEELSPVEVPSTIVADFREFVEGAKK